MTEPMTPYERVMNESVDVNPSEPDVKVKRVDVYTTSVQYSSSPPVEVTRYKVTLEVDGKEIVRSVERKVTEDVSWNSTR